MTFCRLFRAFGAMGRTAAAKWALAGSARELAPAGLLSTAPARGLVAALNGGAAARENVCIASDTHVGVWSVVWSTQPAVRGFATRSLCADDHCYCTSNRKTHICATIVLIIVMHYQDRSASFSKSGPFDGREC